jgi:hypothetical protein
MDRLNAGALTRSIGAGAAALAMFGALSGIPGIGPVCCCIALFVLAAAGATYPFFVSRGFDAAPMPASSAAAGGAITGTISGLVFGVIVGITALILGSESALAQIEATGLNMGGDTLTLMALTVVLTTCFGVVMGAAMGAIGAVLFVTVRRPKGSVPPTL